MKRIVTVTISSLLLVAATVAVIWVRVSRVSPLRPTDISASEAMRMVRLFDPSPTTYKIYDKVLQRLPYPERSICIGGDDHSFQVFKYRLYMRCESYLGNSTKFYGSNFGRQYSLHRFYSESDCRNIALVFAKRHFPDSTRLNSVRLWSSHEYEILPGKKITEYIFLFYQTIGKVSVKQLPR